MVLKSEPIYGYAGKILRVNLSDERLTAEDENPAFMRKYLGGMCLGARILYDEVPPTATWSDPDNRLIIAAGPLNGTRVMGSGTSCIVTIGPMTEYTLSSQANGFSGAFLKFSGFDAMIIQGKASHLSYLYIHDGRAELRDARHLAGKDSWETEELIKQELGYTPHQVSVITIGPAGENLVRFAAIFADRGHVAAHGGLGAVMGAKNLKAIAIARGKAKVPVYDGERLSAEVNKWRKLMKDSPVFKDGTLWIIPRNISLARAPILNYTTNVSPLTEEQFESFTPSALKEKFPPLKHHPCWGCNAVHCYTVKIPEGPTPGLRAKYPNTKATYPWALSWVSMIVAPLPLSVSRWTAWVWM